MTEWRDSKTSMSIGNLFTISPAEGSRGETNSTSLRPSPRPIAERGLIPAPTVFYPRSLVIGFSQEALAPRGRF